MAWNNDNVTAWGSEVKCRACGKLMQLGDEYQDLMICPLIVIHAACEAKWNEQELEWKQQEEPAMTIKSPLIGDGPLELRIAATWERMEVAIGSVLMEGHSDVVKFFRDEVDGEPFLHRVAAAVARHWGIEGAE